LGAAGESLKAESVKGAVKGAGAACRLHVLEPAKNGMNLYRVESQLTSLERLVPHLLQHGCDISAQDAARVLMRYFDDARPSQPGDREDDLLDRENRALGSVYAELRGRLKDIAEGRSGFLPIEKVAAFTRFYREHMLRAAAAAPRVPSRDDLDS
jgi:hypothetical protein